MLPGHALVWTLKGAATSSFASNVRPTHLLLAPANPTTMPNRNNSAVRAPGTLQEDCNMRRLGLGVFAPLRYFGSSILQKRDNSKPRTSHDDRHET
jgi:hypothetical protein